MQKKIKTILSVRVLTETRIGFRVPMEETVKLYSLNSKKKDLEREWKNDGIPTLQMMIPDKNILEVKNIEYQKPDGSKINF